MTQATRHPRRLFVGRGDGQVLDAWRNHDTEVRVAVEAWWAVVPVEDQFIKRKLDPRLVWNYLLRVGPVATWRKVRSRLAERRRNRRIAGLGVGRVLEGPTGSDLRIGDRVIFFAPNHSAGWRRITIDRRLVVPASGTHEPVQPDAAKALAALTGWVGWSPYAGIDLDTSAVRNALDRLAQDGEPGTPKTPALVSTSDMAACERLERHVRPTGRRTAVLFGFGNYAKTQILPQVRRYLDLQMIHEIDPDQLSTAEGFGAGLDTSPMPRPTERYDAWFIAGFHHSHAALAERALMEGGYAVVEKPLATTRAQFTQVQRAARESAGRRLFVCFHKRYSRLSDWAREDLITGDGAPVDMHCLVYEIPLPALHWYNWPVSGSRLISNGCHWLDYFLFLNEYAPVTDASAHRLRGADLLARVQLGNGAQFVMTLTDCGSERLGVRDIIELRAGNVTVRQIDGATYLAENSRRVLRRRRINPMSAYRRMYRVICRAIARGDDGDASMSLSSTALMLDLEDDLRSVITSVPRTGFKDGA